MFVSDTHTDKHTDPNEYSYTNGHPDGDPNSYVHSYHIGNQYTDVDPNVNRNTYGYAGSRHLLRGIHTNGWNRLLVR